MDTVRIMYNADIAGYEGNYYLAKDWMDIPSLEGVTALERQLMIKIAALELEIKRLKNKI